MAPIQDTTANSATASVVVVMASYNPNPEFFTQQIRSLQAQTYSNWKCLIIDDASDRASFEFIQSFVRDDARFQIHRQDKNCGASYSFVRALSLVPADTNFLSFCDQDDIWHPSKIAEQAKVLKQGKYQLTFCDRTLIDSHGNLLEPTHWIDTRVQDLEPNLDQLIFRNTVPGNSMMFDFQLIKNYCPFEFEKNPLFFHDALIASLVAMNGKIHSDSRQLVLYRQHDHNLVGYSSRFEPRKLVSLIRSSKRTAQERLELLQTIKSLIVKDRQLSPHLELLQRLQKVYQNPLRFLLYGMNRCRHNPQFIKHYVLLMLGIIVMKVKPN